MSRHKHIVCATLLCIVSNISCKVIFNEFSKSQIKDQCKGVCNDNFFLLPTVSESNAICERGCRLFNIIDAEGNNIGNQTKIACHASCNEAYISSSFDACILGCNEMEKKRTNDITGSVFLYIEQGDADNIMVVQPELEQMELDIFSSPGLRNQRYNFEYKIPETHIRTMPINSGVDNYEFSKELTLQAYQPTGDWLDCASRNSGIPRWILVSAILMAALIGVWLIFATDKRDPIVPPDVPDMVPNDVEYTAPPKYSLESEKV